MGTLEAFESTAYPAEGRTPRDVGTIHCTLVEVKQERMKEWKDKRKWRAKGERKITRSGGKEHTGDEKRANLNNK
jgi:hypothetical protein